MKQLIRTYKNSFGRTAQKNFERDAEKLAKDGWKIQSQSVGGTLSRTYTVVYTKDEKAE